MTKYEFNINYYMYVKLTDFGKQKIIEKCGYEYFKHCIESNLQPDGYYQLQAHTVMNLLGEYCYNGARELPFELKVYFTSDDLTPQTGTWRLETDEEEPNPMFKHVVCSNCGGTSGTTFKFCPNCGTKMFKE